eukprot:13774714-Alexandrium_andersonii.AAC.1
MTEGVTLTLLRKRKRVTRRNCRSRLFPPRPRRPWLRPRIPAELGLPRVRERVAVTKGRGCACVDYETATRTGLSYISSPAHITASQTRCGERPHRGRPSAAQ